MIENNEIVETSVQLGDRTEIIPFKMSTTKGSDNISDETINVRT